MLLSTRFRGHEFIALVQSFAKKRKEAILHVEKVELRYVECKNAHSGRPTRYKGLPLMTIQNRSHGLMRDFSRTDNEQEAWCADVMWMSPDQRDAVHALLVRMMEGSYPSPHGGDASRSTPKQTEFIDRQMAMIEMARVMYCRREIAQLSNDDKVIAYLKLWDGWPADNQDLQVMHNLSAFTDLSWQKRFRPLDSAKTYKKQGHQAQCWNSNKHRLPYLLLHQVGSKDALYRADYRQTRSLSAVQSYNNRYLKRTAWSTMSMLPQTAQDFAGACPVHTFSLNMALQKASIDMPTTPPKPAIIRVTQPDYRPFMYKVESADSVNNV